MELRGIAFPPAVNSPFWRRHPLMASMTETLTLSGNAGPKPRTVVKFGAGVTLSGVRESSTDLKTYLLSDKARKETKPFYVAFKPVLGTRKERLGEVRQAVPVLAEAKGALSAPFALVIDLTGIPSEEDVGSYTKEAREILALLSALEIPLVPMVSLLLSPDAAADILMDPHADALFLSDAIRWSDLPPRAQKVFFQTNESPLASIGGMVRGKYLLPLATEWIRQLRRQFVQKPIITGAGLLRVRDVGLLKEAGASAVFMGDVGRLRPWNGGRILRRAHEIFVSK